MALGSLSDDERRVYEFVVRRFLACCSDDAKGELTTVEIEYGSETFFANGLLVLQKNYLLVYPYDKWESSQQLPRFTFGETFEPTEANMSEGETGPPGYLTEPELISLMDANGIGTDATMAEHIAKIKEREYVMTQTSGGNGQGEAAGRGGREGRGGRRGGRSGNAGRGGGNQRFIPTTLGVALIEGYDSIGLETSLGKPFLRKEMEIKMKEICAGTKSRNDFVQETLEQYRHVFIRTQQQVELLKAVRISDRTTDGLKTDDFPTGLPEVRSWRRRLMVQDVLRFRRCRQPGMICSSHPAWICSDTCPFASNKTFRVTGCGILHGGDTGHLHRVLQRS